MQNNNILLSEIAHFKCQNNFKGGTWGNVFITLKSGKKVFGNYDEEKVGKREHAEAAIRRAIEDNESIIF